MLMLLDWTGKYRDVSYTYKLSNTCPVIRAVGAATWMSALEQTGNMCK